MPETAVSADIKPPVGSSKSADKMPFSDEELDRIRSACDNLRQFKYGVWYRVKVDGSVVVACLHHRQQPEIAKARALGREPSP
jgi:hypothetical protein